MKAGAFTPAILDGSGGHLPRNCNTLNEGGGFHPRNPGPVPDNRHPPRVAIAPLNEGGAFTPAIRVEQTFGEDPIYRLAQ